MLTPTGFWSYGSSDDKHSRGRLSQLRALLAHELQQKIGRAPKVNIFQDVAAIPPGTDWEQQIRESLKLSFFLIPIVTPALLQSEWCCREIELFREREAALGRNDLIFPIHYINVDHLHPPRAEDCFDPETFSFLRTRQWVDFRVLRHKNFETHEDVALKLDTMADAVCAALRADKRTIRSMHAGRDLAGPQARRDVRGSGHEGDTDERDNRSHLHLPAVVSPARNERYRTAPSAKSPSSANHQEFKERWIHETTEDDRFTGRRNVLSDLDRWAADTKARVIAVTGMGGLGKTSLVAHWLKDNAEFAAYSLDGILFWSVYADRDLKRLFSEIVDFAIDLGAPAPPGRHDEPGAARQAMRQASMLLFIDGLELLQDLPSADGACLPEDLRQLLDWVCTWQRKSLVILTSRFSFADLARHKGGGFRELQLEHLSPAEGAALLAACDVAGSESDRVAVAQEFHGHPLGLRLFALALEQQGHRNPGRLVQQVFGNAGPGSDVPLARKLRHLLEFYENQMPRLHVALLGIVSFFRSLAPVEAILDLARRLPAVADATEDRADVELRAALHKLGRQHLLIGDVGQKMWSCHPILRDHFRQSLLGWSPDVARGAAEYLENNAFEIFSAHEANLAGETDFVTARPSRDRPRSLRQLEPVIAAVELLLVANNFRVADQLFRERLEDGNIFRQLALPNEGMRCALAFVWDDGDKKGDVKHKDPLRAEHANGDQFETKAAVRKIQLSEIRVADYCRHVGVFARQAGEFEFGANYFERCVEAYRRIDQKRELSIALQNWTGLLIILGRLSDAEQRAREAIQVTKSDAQEGEDLEQLKGSLTYLATVLGKQGRTSEAKLHFESARQLELRTRLKVETLFGNRGIRYADFLLRLGDIKTARWTMEANLQICRNNGWHEEMARCWSVLGEVAIRLGHEALARGHVEEAESHFNNADNQLRAAEQVFRGGHTVSQIPRVLLARADLERRRKNWEAANEAVEEAWGLAAPRQMRLDHADSLVMRALVSLDQAEFGGLSSSTAADAADRARIDATQALQIARDWGYAWAELDAIRLLQRSYEWLDDAQNAASFCRQAEATATRLMIG